MTNQDPFGISKKDKSGKFLTASKGRLATGALFPGFHGAVAGKEGRKAKAAGYEVGGSLVAGPPGGVVGTQLAENKGFYKKQKLHKSAFGIEDISKSMKSCASCGHKHDCSGVSKAVLLPKPFKGLKPIKPKGLKPSKPGANSKTDNTSAGGTV